MPEDEERWGYLPPAPTLPNFSSPPKGASKLEATRGAEGGGYRTALAAAKTVRGEPYPPR